MPINREYSDLDLNFIPHPHTKDIVPLTGVDAVIRSVRNLLLSNFYERPFRSDIGSGVTGLLFEPMDPLTKYTLREYVYNVLKKYEKRISIIDVGIYVNEDQNGFNVSVQFNVENMEDVLSVTVFIERVR